MKKIKLNSMYGVFGCNNFEDKIDSFNYLMNEISKVENDIKDLKTSKCFFTIFKIKILPRIIKIYFPKVFAFTN